MASAVFRARVCSPESDWIAILLERALRKWTNLRDRIHHEAGSASKKFLCPLLSIQRVVIIFDVPRRQDKLRGKMVHDSEDEAGGGGGSRSSLHATDVGFKTARPADGDKDAETDIGRALTLASNLLTDIDDMNEGLDNKNKAKASLMALSNVAKKMVYVTV